jgi:hypothetical protein
MASAVIGLVANLAPWRAGSRDAATIMKGALNERTLDGFNRGVDNAFRRMESKGRGLFGGFQKGIGALRGTWVALGSVVSAVAFSRVTSEIAEAVGKAREFADMLDRIQLGAEAAGRSFDVGRAGAFTRDLAGRTGNKQSELAGILSQFAQKWDQANAQYLTGLTVDLSAKLGRSLDEAARLVQYTQMGNLRPFKTFNIPMPKDTGSPEGNAAAGIAELQRQAPQGTAAKMADVDERIAARWETLQIDVGTKLIPTVDKILTGVEMFIKGLDPEKLAFNVEKMYGVITWVARAGERLWGNMPLKRLLDVFDSDEWNSQAWRMTDVLDNLASKLQGTDVGAALGKVIPGDAALALGIHPNFVDQPTFGPRNQMPSVGELLDGGKALRGRFITAFTSPPSSGLGDFARDAMNRGRQQLEAEMEASKSAPPPAPAPDPASLVDPFAREATAAAAAERRRREEEQRQREAERARESLAQNARAYSSAPAGQGFSVSVQSRYDPRLAKQRLAGIGRKR